MIEYFSHKSRPNTISHWSYQTCLTANSPTSTEIINVHIHVFSSKGFCIYSSLNAGFIYKTEQCGKNLGLHFWFLIIGNRWWCNYARCIYIDNRFEYRLWTSWDTEFLQFCTWTWPLTSSQTGWVKWNASTSSNRSPHNKSHFIWMKSQTTEPPLQSKSSLCEISLLWVKSNSREYIAPVYTC